jgi:nicotinamide-nucleotide amidase
MGGIISYSNVLKEKLLGVPGAVLAENGAVSEPVAKAMAEGACRAANADFGISVTGIAGPEGGTEEKPVGLVYIGLAGGGDTVIRRFVFDGDRSKVRESAAKEALTMRLNVL